MTHRTLTASDVLPSVLRGVNPEGVLDLVGTAGQHVGVGDAADAAVAVGLHHADAAEEVIREAGQLLLQTCACAQEEQRG